MKNRALFCMFAIALAVTACDGMRIFGGGGPTPTKVCDNNGTCQLDVTVDNCNAGGTGIHVDHEVAGMKKGNADIKIHWQLKTHGYEFPPQAMKFTSAQFSPSSGNTNNQFVNDRNSPGSGTSPHKYSITVVKTGGAACATKDPIIVNDY